MIYFVTNKLIVTADLNIIWNEWAKANVQDMLYYVKMVVRDKYLDNLNELFQGDQGKHAYKGARNRRRAMNNVNIQYIQFYVSTNLLQESKLKTQLRPLKLWLRIHGWVTAWSLIKMTQILLNDENSYTVCIRKQWNSEMIVIQYLVQSEALYFRSVKILKPPVGSIDERPIWIV